MSTKDDSTKTYHALAGPMLWNGVAFALVSLLSCSGLCLSVSIPGVLLTQDIMIDEFPVLLFTIGIFFFIVILVTGILWIVNAVSVMGRFFRTLKVSSSGLEYRRPGVFGLQCSWEDVKSLGVIRAPFSHFTFLNLSNAQPSGLWILGKLEGMQLWPRGKYFILLSGLEGWPEGGLADDLRQYAPPCVSRWNDHK